MQCPTPGALSASLKISRQRWRRAAAVCTASLRMSQMHGRSGKTASRACVPEENFQTANDERARSARRRSPSVGPARPVSPRWRRCRRTWPPYSARRAGARPPARPSRGPPRRPRARRPRRAPAARPPGLRRPLRLHGSSGAPRCRALLATAAPPGRPGAATAAGGVCGRRSRGSRTAWTPRARQGAKRPGRPRSRGSAAGRAARPTVWASTPIGAPCRRFI